MKTMIELFSGSKTMSNIFKKNGYKVYTVDFNEDLKPDLVADILDFEIKMLPKEFREPDVVWASPPCTAFSVMSRSHYWRNGKPKIYKTFIGLAIAKKTVEIIEELKPRYWFLENPVGMLRKQHFMQNLPRKTVTYCQYGKSYRKATDIWNNAVHWIPKKMCMPGDKCHEEARRGMKRGTQGIASKDLPSWANWQDDGLTRAMLPKQLCEEILEVCENKTSMKQEVLLS